MVIGFKDLAVALFPIQEINERDGNDHNLSLNCPQEQRKRGGGFFTLRSF